MSDETAAHGGCRVCSRTDVTTKADETLRMHVHANRKGSSFLFPGGNRCRGAGHPPKGVLGRYAKAVLALLAPHFPDLENPITAEVIGEAIQRNHVTPSDALECLLDERGNWRLKSDSFLVGRVRLSCYRFNKTDDDQARTTRINAELDALR